MLGISKTLGAYMGRAAYHFTRSASLAYEHHRPQAFDPASLTPRAALSARHLDAITVLPDRRALLARVPPAGIAVELGVDQGDFSEEILRLAAPRRLHLVDLWGSQRYGADKRESVSRRFAELGDRVEIHINDSVSAAADFADGSLDFVYVDTDHSYALTLAELEAYRPKMAPGGLLAGHDYIIGNWRSRLRYGVIEAVHEFCLRHDWRIRYLTHEFPEHASFALEKI